MKLLVIGIDGGEREIFDAFDLSTINGLLNQGRRFDIEEDLLSRGWAEILSSKHGMETGAFYKKPKLDGTHNFHDSYSTNNYESDDSIEPLWTKLMRMGNKVGFMNVPTTKPAPGVDGFFISGAGGGHVGLDMPADAFFPHRVEEDLRRENYIFDTRFQISGITEKEILCNRLMEMQNNRVNAFTRLSERFRPDFGFITFVSIRSIQYLAMSEIAPMIGNGCIAANAFQKRIIQIYRNFDICISKLLEKLQPDNVMIVSDHGSVPFHTSVNVNHILKKMGLLRNGSSTAAASKNLMKRSLRFIPKPIKRYLRKKTPQIKDYISEVNIDWDNTQAFGASKSSGIYINDKERFGGPVAAPADMDALTDRIIGVFNSDKEAESQGLKAKIYRRANANVKYSKLLPDIWIDHPDDVYFSNRGKFIQPNVNYKPIESLENIDRDMYTCLKGRNPLLQTFGKDEPPSREGDPADLTLAYKLIERIMQR